MTEWEEYLGVPGATEQQIQALEARIGRPLPSDFREALRSHQGQSPKSFSLVLPSGRQPAFGCLFHCDPNSDEYDAYDIGGRMSILEEEHGLHQLVPFAHSGNAVFCIDYSQEDQPIVFVNLDLTREDPGSRVRVASSFAEFCGMTMRG